MLLALVWKAMQTSGFLLCLEHTGSLIPLLHVYFQSRRWHCPLRQDNLSPISLPYQGGCKVVLQKGQQHCPTRPLATNVKIVSGLALALLFTESIARLQCRVNERTGHQRNTGYRGERTEKKSAQDYILDAVLRHFPKELSTEYLESFIGNRDFCPLFVCLFVYCLFNN